MVNVFQTNVLTAAAVVTFITAIIMLVRGYRGRRVNNHLCCRRCNFDLIGSIAIGCDRGEWDCPECGSDLSEKSALRHGVRERSGPMIMAGWMLLVMPCIGAGMGLCSRTSDFDLNNVKPFWALQQEIIREDRDISGTAMDELERRITTDEMSDVQADEFFSLLLRIQKDRSIPWRSRWGELFELGRSKLLVSNEQWQRYIDQAFDLRASFASNYSERDRFGIQYVGWNVVVHFASAPCISDALLNGDVILFDANPFRIKGDVDFDDAVDFSPTDAASLYAPMLRHEKNLQPGSYTVEAHVIAGVADPASYAGQWTSSQPMALNASSKLPLDDPVIHTSHHLADEVRRWITLSDVRKMPVVKENGSVEKMRVRVHVNVSPVVPLDLVMNLRLRIGDETWAFGTFKALRGYGQNTVVTGDVDWFDADQVDVILEPDQGAAKKCIDVIDFLGRPVAFRKQSIQWDLNKHAWIGMTQ